MDNRTAKKLLNGWKCSRLIVSYDDSRPVMPWHIQGLPVSTGWPAPAMVWNEPFNIGRGDTLADAAAMALEAAKGLPKA